MPRPTDIRPSFTQLTAAAKVQAAEDAWNSRDPQRVSLSYTEDSVWRTGTSSSPVAPRSLTS